MKSIAVLENESSFENYLQSNRLSLGQRICEIRKKRGYNQQQLAVKMNVSRSTISKIESGKFNFSIDYLSKFSLALDFKINILDKKILKQLYI